MRPFVATILLPVAASLASAQSAATRTAIPAARPFNHHATIEMGYHEPSGYGLVQLRPMLVAEHPDVQLSAMYSFKGRVLKAPPDAVGIALAVADAPGAFGAAKHIVFTLDDGSKVTSDSLITVIDESSGHHVETRSRHLPRRDFLRVVNATHVTVRAGALEFPLGYEQLEALRDFASRMDPAANAAAVAAAQAQVHVQTFDLKRDFYEAKEVDSTAYPTAVQVLGDWPIGVAHQAHRLAVRYVVDTTGRVDPATFEGMDPADSSWVFVLRDVSRSWEFKPAKKDGKPVRQIVRQVLNFDPKP